MAEAATHPGYINNKEQVLNRLRRISGQVGGLERMVEEERYCIDILTQVSAVQAAIDKVALALLASTPATASSAPGPRRIARRRPRR